MLAEELTNTSKTLSATELTTFLKIVLLPTVIAVIQVEFVDFKIGLEAFQNCRLFDGEKISVNLLLKSLFFRCRHSLVLLWSKQCVLTKL